MDSWETRIENTRSHHLFCMFFLDLNHLLEVVPLVDVFMERARFGVFGEFNIPRNTVKVDVDNSWEWTNLVRNAWNNLSKISWTCEICCKNSTNGFSRYLHIHLYPLWSYSKMSGPSSSRSQLPATTRSFLAAPWVEVSEGPKMVQPRSKLQH